MYVLSSSKTFFALLSEFMISSISWIGRQAAAGHLGAEISSNPVDIMVLRGRPDDPEQAAVA